MLVPLPIVIVGIAIAAILGVAGGWVLGSAAASKAHRDSEGGKVSAQNLTASEANQSDPLQQAWDRLPFPKVVLCWRLDGIETWRRTHGQRTVEAFLGEVSRIIEATLADGACVQPVGDEVIAVAGGDEDAVTKASSEVRRSKFHHADGAEALVSASIGYVVGAEDSLQVHVSKAFAACSEAGRKRRGGVGEWLPTGIRHVRPVDGST